jgi:hypothetical protein
VNSHPFGRPVATGGRDLQVVALQHGAQQPKRVLPNLPTRNRVNASAFAFPVNSGSDSSDVPLIRNFVQALPAGCWRPEFVVLHNLRVQHLPRCDNAI